VCRPHMMCALCGGVWAADVADMNRDMHCDARLSHVVSVGVAAHLRLGRRNRGAIVFGCEEGAHQACPNHCTHSLDRFQATNVCDY
jgi:hypothetical protein